MPTEAALRTAAAANAEDVRRALGWPRARSAPADRLRDPWGTPLAFMPRQSPAVGMAPSDVPFFVSAGPDRQFLTRADNLYSYDYADPDAPRAPTTAPPPEARGVCSSPLAVQPKPTAPRWVARAAP